MTQTPYTEKWRSAVRLGAIRSAEALVPMLNERFQPRSVIDVGCGEGWFCRAWANAGVDSVTGLDGGYVDVRIARDDHRPARWSFMPCDLSAPFTGTCDLAMSLEVAEHLPPARAESFVADLCALAPIVVFSAAAPGQGGEGHVNEQWATWWADRFLNVGYEVSGELRWPIWEDDRIGCWYRQNLLVAAAPGILARHSLARGVVDVIHPGMWAWKGHA